MMRVETEMRQISDALWARVRPLLAEHLNPHPRGGGRPRQSDRACLEAILYVLRTGCRWKALGRLGLCPGSTAHDRFREWVADGFFHRLRQAGLLHGEELGAIDWG